MSISAIYILDLNGKVLLGHNYRDDLSPYVIDKFMQALNENEEDGKLTPIVQCENCSFAYIKVNDLFLVAATPRNAHIVLVLMFLFKLKLIMIEYFRELEEESIRDNFVVIYELFDEILDFGYPQTTDVKILQEYIMQERYVLKSKPRQIPVAVTNAISWRSPNVKHRKNEVFLDVIESINLLGHTKGHVFSSEVFGQLKMKVHLTGMPELRLGLNDRIIYENSNRNTDKAIDLDNVQLHQCVRLSNFNSDRTISFVPPDGEFVLMTYRLNANAKPPISLETDIETFQHSRIEYTIKARAQFKQRSAANNVEIIVPVPMDVDSPQFQSSIGSVNYEPAQNVFIWSIKTFPGAKEFVLHAHFNLPSVQNEERDAKIPIKIQFEIPYFATSGLHVRYLKIIEKSGYHALAWVRYITQNGDYQFRF